MREESIIQDLYDKIEEEGTNIEYKRLCRKAIEFRDRFEEQLTEDQKEELEKLICMRSDLADLECRKYFYKGFSMATRLITEIFYKEDK